MAHTLKQFAVIASAISSTADAGPGGKEKVSVVVSQYLSGTRTSWRRI